MNCHENKMNASRPQVSPVVIPAQARLAGKPATNDFAPSFTSSFARKREQGSLLVLVVVCLVLMALLGTAYLQVARVDRFATADFQQNDIDQVANATINYIGKLLRDDLVNQDGGFFSPVQGSSAANITNSYLQGYGDENYDYPFTNSAGYPALWAVTLDDGAAGLADGGLYDDTWLASSVPTFTGANPDASWRHLSNIMGTYLRIPASGNGLAAPFDKQPEELPTRAADATDWRNDSNVGIGTGGTPLTDDNGTNSLPLGTDTDLDGIPDAKWQWAPLRQIGSKKYVMAVRIIDNSSMINLNTATAITNNGTATPANVRGYFPSDIDLSRITSRMSGTPPWQAELATNTTAPDESLFFRRGVNTGAVLTPPGTATIDAAGNVNWSAGTTTRAGAWLETIRLWADPANKLALANEMELRRLGGVNNDNVATSVEDAMPTLLRKLNSELTYADVATNPGYPAGLTADQQVMAYFLGVDTAAPADPQSSVNLRQFPALRTQFTTQSSAALYASNAGGANPFVSGQFERRLKYDLVHGDGGNTINNSARLGELYARLLRIFRVADNGSVANTATASAYLGFDKGVVAERNTLSDIAYEYALAIQDYSDADRLPSSVTPAGAAPSVPGGRTYYSLETLPFFREGYVQAAYRNRDLTDAIGNPGTDGIPDTFIYTPDSMALAFEIGNPFDRPIDFNAAAPDPAIRVKVGTNLYPLTGTLNSREVRVFYANTLLANRRAEGNEGTPRGDLIADLGLTAGPSIVALPEGPAYTVGTRIVFELQVEVAAGVWVTYDRLAPDAVAPGQMVYVPSDNHADPSALAADLDLYHLELFNMVRPVSIGAAAGPYYISNENTDLIRYAATSNRNVFLVNSDQLLVASKLNSGGSPLDGNPNLTDYQLPSANRQFMSVAELGWIQMFGFYSNNGVTPNPADDELGDFPTRMRDMAVTRRRLVLNDPAGPSFSNMRMPHASLVFDQFTTLSPRNDGLDNDNDGTIDNESEQSVRGQININTAPLHLLTLAAPLNESVGDIQALMQTLIHYRDNPTARVNMSSTTPTISRTQPGISSMGELLLMDNPAYDSAVTAPTLTPTSDMTTPPGRIDAYSFFTPAAFAGSDFDLYPMPEEAATQHPVRSDSNEAKLARLQFLTQAFNTRSDTFTAYVRLRGYPAQDFSNGEVESRSFLVVFDRSNIVSASDMPKIIGVYVYNVP